MLRRALVHCIQEIGEAAAKVTQAGRDRSPNLPWAKMVGMRHILVHVYHDLDLDAIWNVAAKELERLLAALGEALRDGPAPEPPGPSAGS